MTQKSLQKSRLLLSETEHIGKIGGWEFDVATLQQIWTEETFNILEIDTKNGTPIVPEGLEFFTEECRPLVAEKLQRAIELGEPYNEEWEIITMKGNKKWVHAVAKAEMENGKTKKVSGSFQDISKRKKAELELRESEHRFRSLLSHIDAGIVVHATDTAIINCNPKAEALLGLSKEQLTGKLAIDAAWHFMYEDKTLVPLDKFPVNQISTSRQPVNNLIIGVNRPATNDVVWLMVNGFPVLDSSGLIKEIVISFIDITRLKLAEENLQQSNAALEQFAYSASHDLQEPLRMVTGFLALIEKKYANEIDATGKSYINYAVDGAKRMHQVIQDLLEYARIGKTLYNKETIDINSLITETELLLQQRIADKNAIIEVGAKLPAIQGYRAPIRQVFLNLIGNALTYSRDGKQPHVKIDAVDTGGFWQFSIADNGIGIAEANHEKIFEIFKRLHSNEKYSGTGIGLAITKKVIELQGGKIWLKSEEGKGSTFYFTIKK
jgi:PAS domain S-box-containing protein